MQNYSLYINFNQYKTNESYSAKMNQTKCVIRTTKLPMITGSLIPVALDSSLDPSIVEYTTKEAPKNHSI